MFGLLAAWFALATCLQPARALDPTRALTQSIHRIWQTQQGLPQGTIYCVYQSRDRYLWLGTKSGLVRFDGVQFMRMDDLGAVSLDNVWIHQLCQDAQGTFWVATDRDGLVRYASGKGSRFTFDDGLPSNNAHCVYVDRDDNVWVGTDRGLARVAAGEIEAFSSENGPGSEEIRAICQAVDGSLWFAGEGNRLHVKRGQDFSVVVLDGLPETARITALSEFNGSIWIGTSEGLFQLQGNQPIRYTTADGLADDQVHCLLKGSNDSLWIGTGDGFSRYRAGQFQNFRTQDGLSQSTVYSICEDHEGSLWVGTKLGLNQFVDRRTIPFTISEGLPSNNTGPIEQDAAGNIWVGTLDAGLARWNGTGFASLTTDDGLPSNVMRALAAADDGALWVGTDRGLCKVMHQKVVETITTEDGLPSNDVRSLCSDINGILWVGTEGGIVSWKDGKPLQAILPKGFSGQESIVAIARYHDGAVVAALRNGALLECKEDQWTAFETQGQRLTNVSALCAAEKKLYVATEGDGLYVFDGRQAVHLSVRDGLYDDELFGLASDDRGQLWIACSKGVFSIRHDDVAQFATGKIVSVPTTPLSPLDALRTVECQPGVQPAVKRMDDGRVWFATIRGVLVIDPSHWQRVLPPTSVVVEDVIINGKSEDPYQFQAVPPGNANLTFRYAALSYTSPSRITFRYRLEGFDNKWVEAGSRREAFYTNIPPGRYRFVVAATNVDGKLYETASPVELSIAPNFYQTSWFLPACVVMAGLLVWFAYRLRVRAIRQQMSAIIVERSRIARELHDGLMQGFAGITMEMQALSSSLPKESAERDTLEEIIDDAGDCLREARRSIAGLRGSLSGLKAAIEQTARQLAETHDLRLDLQLSPVATKLSAEAEYNLLRIAQEAITNAFKHHGGGSKVEVTLENTGNEVRLIVHDDGVGFIEPDQPSSHSGHYGLVGMRERARQIGAKFDLHSKPGHGTTVQVVLPTKLPLADTPLSQSSADV